MSFRLPFPEDEARRTQREEQLESPTLMTKRAKQIAAEKALPPLPVRKAWNRRQSSRDEPSSVEDTASGTSDLEELHNSNDDRKAQKTLISTNPIEEWINAPRIVGDGMQHMSDEEHYDSLQEYHRISQLNPFVNNINDDPRPPVLKLALISQLDALKKASVSNLPPTHSLRKSKRNYTIKSANSTRFPVQEPRTPEHQIHRGFTSFRSPSSNRLAPHYLADGNALMDRQGRPIKAAKLEDPFVDKAGDKKNTLFMKALEKTKAGKETLKKTKTPKKTTARNKILEETSDEDAIIPFPRYDLEQY